MATLSIELDALQAQAFRKFLNRLDYNVIRESVDRTEEARALLMVLQTLRADLDLLEPGELRPLHWNPD